MKTPLSVPLTVLAHFLLIFCLAGCLGTPIEEEPPEEEQDVDDEEDEEEDEMNFPPHIDDNFLEPREDVIRVEDDDPVILAASTLLDPNAEEQLHYTFIGERSGILLQAAASRQPKDERYRDLFYLYDRAEVEIDPCKERLRDQDDELIRLFVSDRPFQRVTEVGVEIADDAHLVAHRWLLRFRPQLCQ